jgi:BirA family biotin operon repressor/biotin-[acetyl-CoA-carboxylase] ligase
MGTALALARLSSQLGCPGIGLKWPNDLLLGRRKAAGILAEMQHPPHGIPQLLVGVGLNVSIPEQTLGTVGQPATSLSIESGLDLDPNDVLEQFLSLWSQVDSVLETDGFAALVDEYRAYSDLAGRKFRLAGAQGVSEEVRVVTIRDDGALVVERIASGTQEAVHGGELLPIGG